MTELKILRTLRATHLCFFFLIKHHFCLLLLHFFFLEAYKSVYYFSNKRYIRDSRAGWRVLVIKMITEVMQEINKSKRNQITSRFDPL